MANAGTIPGFDLTITLHSIQNRTKTWLSSLHTSMKHSWELNRIETWSRCACLQMAFILFILLGLVINLDGSEPPYQISVSCLTKLLQFVVYFFTLIWCLSAIHASFLSQRLNGDWTVADIYLTNCDLILNYHSDIPSLPIQGCDWEPHIFYCKSQLSAAVPNLWPMTLAIPAGANQ